MQNLLSNLFENADYHNMECRKPLNFALQLFYPTESPFHIDVKLSSE